MMRNKKFLLGAVLVVLLLIFAVGGTLAYLVTQTDPVVNTFTPAEAGVSVDDNVSGQTKSNVEITNTSDFAVYVRVAVVANWYKGDDVVDAWNDYESLGVGDDWLLGSDGYYYYKTPVQAGYDVTLFTTYTAVTTGHEGEHLEMDIIAQVIQAEPATAVVDAWHVTLDGTTITAATGN